MQYKYFGENTVQIKRCVRRIVQAAITAATLHVVNRVSTATCPLYTLQPVSSFQAFLSKSMVVAEVQYIGAAQLLTNVRRPTVATLKSETPL
jgi:hypothetical protein